MVNNFNFSFFCDSQETCNTQVNDSDIQMLTNITASLGPIDLNNFQLSKPVIVIFEVDRANNIIQLDSINNSQEVTFTIVAIDNGEIKNVRLKKGNEIIIDNLEEIENKYTFKKTFNYNDYNTSNTYETYSVEVIDNLYLKTERLITINVKKILPPVISKFSSNKTDNQIILTSINQSSAVIFDIEIKENDGNIISNDRIINVKVKKGNNIIENNLTMSQNKYTFAQLYEYNNLNSGLNEELYEVIVTDDKNQMITKNLVFKIIKDTPPVILSFESNVSDNKIELIYSEQSKNVLFTIEVNDNNGELLSTNSISNVMIRNGSNLLINNIIINSDKKYTYTKTYNYNLYSEGDTTETLQAVVSDIRGQITTKNLVLNINKAPPPPPPGLLYTHHVHPDSRFELYAIDGKNQYMPGPWFAYNKPHLVNTYFKKPSSGPNYLDWDTINNALEGYSENKFSWWWGLKFIKSVKTYNGKKVFQFTNKSLGGGYHGLPLRLNFKPKIYKDSAQISQPSYIYSKDNKEGIYLTNTVDCWNKINSFLNGRDPYPSAIREALFKKVWYDSPGNFKDVCINDDTKSYYYLFDKEKKIIQIIDGAQVGGSNDIKIEKHNLFLKNDINFKLNKNDVNTLYDIYIILKDSFINKDNNSSLKKYVENLNILNKKDILRVVKFLYINGKRKNIDTDKKLKEFIIDKLKLDKLVSIKLMSF